MGAFVVTSIAVHLAVIGATGRDALRYLHIAPVMQVQIRSASPEKPVTLAVESDMAQLEVSDATVEKNTPEIQSVDVRQPVDTQRLLNLPADIYFANSEVDVRAEPLEEVNLVYPLIAFQERQSGLVTIAIYVNERGGVDKTTIVDARPVGVFEEAALQAVAKLKFSPAIRNGKPVKNRKTIAINFDPYEKIYMP